MDAEGCADCLSGLFLLEGDVQMTVSIDLLRPDGQKAWGDDWIRIVGSEGSLEANGVGENAEERSAMAREMIGVLKDGLHQAMTDSPGILFVTAAGNDDNDVEFDVVIPSSFNLPNLMVVGALDQAGDVTSFTSGGENVRVYANGFQVDSFVFRRESKHSRNEADSMSTMFNL